MIEKASLNIKALYEVFFIKHETRWSSQNYAENLLKIFLMAKLVFFAINLD